MFIIKNGLCKKKKKLLWITHEFRNFKKRENKESLLFLTLIDLKKENNNNNNKEIFPGIGIKYKENQFAKQLVFVKFFVSEKKRNNNNIYKKKEKLNRLEKANFSC